MSASEPDSLRPGRFGASAVEPVTNPADPADPAAPVDPDDPAGAPRLPDVGTRRRSTIALVTGVVLMNVSMVPAGTVGSLLASDRYGPAWSGVPSASGVIGTALGALGLSALMRSRGRRAGLRTGYAIAATGALVGAVAVGMAVLPLLAVGMVLLGIGNGGAQLSRYAVADLHPADRKAFVLSLVVWGSTVGALVGPGLIAPAAHLSARAGIPEYAGTYVLAILTTGAALVVAGLLPRAGSGDPRTRERPRSGEVGRVLRLPAVRVALAGMVSAQLAMVAVMTMTPLQLHRHGQGLDVVGWVLSAHLAGMFALSPLSGRLTDRLGGRTVISAGAGALIGSAALAMAAPTSHTVGIPLALFLLGYGWNLCFVGGSAILSRELPAGVRSQVQGTVDAVVWGSSASAGLASGAVFAGGGYVLVAFVAGLIAVAPLVVLLASRPRLASPQGVANAP
ncbi:MFS transporter [Actinopolymorpha rutila]|uniref:MFS family permease n=1 Tax=Actinopolymorpha rutila TaxID=446787 RepID=A0A852ZE76_9ACTN|nr:MFS transporter [Actinopolymorpha rutila]NYH90022.1 MFS family permease [Actinopolymorpha rutila]